MDNAVSAHVVEAIDAAARGGRQLGLDVRHCRILQTSNNVVVHLTPSPTVAKVGPRPALSRQLESLQRELDVALHLVQYGAPVAEPLPEMAHQVYHVNGFPMTFWRYYESDREKALQPGSAAKVLRVVHRGLESYPGELPQIFGRHESVSRYLRPGRLPAGLTRSDYTFILEQEIELDDAKVSARFEPRPLHGAPHRFNWLLIDQRLLLTDFETAGRGPLEWDLAYMEDLVEGFPEANSELLRLCRRLVALAVTVACWVGRADHPELGWHADHHLARLKEMAT